MFFRRFKKCIPNSVLSRFQCLCGRSALQQNLQSSEKSKHFKENTIFNEHPVSKSIINDSSFTEKLSCHYLRPSYFEIIRIICPLSIYHLIRDTEVSSSTYVFPDVERIKQMPLLDPNLLIIIIIFFFLLKSGYCRKINTLVF